MGGEGDEDVAGLYTEGERAQEWCRVAPAKSHAPPAVPVEATAHERAYVHLWKTYDTPERRNLKL